MDSGQREVHHRHPFNIDEGEALGLVGESGSGKSMTARRSPGCSPRAPRSPAGSPSTAPTSRPRGGACAVTAPEVAVVFQDPRAHINPVRRIDDFMTETLRSLEDVPKDEAVARAAEALEEVGIDDPAKRLRQYPHELSGGMLQRVMIATALLPSPRLLLADECTTALDVTTQAEVMAILDELRRDPGLSMLFITHDLELAGGGLRPHLRDVRRADRRDAGGDRAARRSAAPLQRGTGRGPPRHHATADAWWRSRAVRSRRSRRRRAAAFAPRCLHVQPAVLEPRTGRHRSRPAGACAANVPTELRGHLLDGAMSDRSPRAGPVPSSRVCARCSAPASPSTT